MGSKYKFNMKWMKKAGNLIMGSYGRFLLLFLLLFIFSICQRRNLLIICYLNDSIINYKEVLKGTFFFNTPSPLPILSLLHRIVWDYFIQFWRKISWKTLLPNITYTKWLPNPITFIILFKCLPTPLNNHL